MGAARLGLAASEHAALRWPCKQIAAAAALLAGAGYVLITGMHIPVLRSFAMACLVTLGVATGRRAFSLRGLALAAMVLVLASPEEVVGVSFQMSFAAVLALIAGYEALRPALARLYRKARPLLSGHPEPDQPAGGRRIGPVRRISFRPGAALFRAGEPGRRAAHRHGRDASRAARPGADAARPGAFGADPDGLDAGTPCCGSRAPYPPCQPQPSASRTCPAGVCSWWH